MRGRIFLSLALLLARPAFAADYELAGPADEGVARLEIVSWRCEKTQYHTEIFGEVKNITKRPISSFYPAGLFRDDKGELVASESGSVEFKPLRAGKSTPFHVNGPIRLDIARCEVHFTNFSGEIIPWRESETAKLARENDNEARAKELALNEKCSQIRRDNLFGVATDGKRKPVPADCPPDFGEVPR